MAALSRLMPNFGGLRPVERKLLASVVHSQLLFAALVQCLSLVFQNHMQLLFGSPAHHGFEGRQCLPNGVVSTRAILVVSVHLMENGRVQKNGKYQRISRWINIWGCWQQESEKEIITGVWVCRSLSVLNRTAQTVPYNPQVQKGWF